MTPASVGVVAAACCAWVIWRLLQAEPSEALRAVEWLFPIRGRWLRYVLVGIAGVLLLVCLLLTLTGSAGARGGFTVFS